VREKRSLLNISKKWMYKSNVVLSLQYKRYVFYFIFVHAQVCVCVCVVCILLLTIIMEYVSWVISLFVCYC